MIDYRDQNSNIRKGYNRLAFCYDALAYLFFFNRIVRSQTALIPHLSTVRNCLIIGGGSGIFLEQFLLEHSEAKIVYIDLSDKMIEKARKRIQDKIPFALSQIEFRCIPFEHLQDGCFDVIVLNYFLDLFPESEVDRILKKCSAYLQSNGNLYVSDFSIPETKLFKDLAMILLKLLYTFFKITTSIETNALPAFVKLLNNNQFYCIHSVQFWKGIMFSGIYKKRHPLKFERMPLP